MFLIIAKRARDEVLCLCPTGETLTVTSSHQATEQSITCVRDPEEFGHAQSLGYVIRNTSVAVADEIEDFNHGIATQPHENRVETRRYRRI